MSFRARIHAGPIIPINNCGSAGTKAGPRGPEFNADRRVRREAVIYGPNMCPESACAWPGGPGGGVCAGEGLRRRPGVYIYADRGRFKDPGVVYARSVTRLY